MAALVVTRAQLACNIQVPPNRVTGILNHTRAVTADTALRLGRYFGMSAEFWMDLQQLYELRRATEQIGSGIEAIPGRNLSSSHGEHASPI